MAKKENKKQDGPAPSTFAFTRENYKLMLIGVAILVIGFLLMIGGGSKDPNIFTGDELFSFRRITLSPLVILVGFVVVLFAILKKPKKENTSEE